MPARESLMQQLEAHRESVAASPFKELPDSVGEWWRSGQRAALVYRDLVLVGRMVESRLFAVRLTEWGQQQGLAVPVPQLPRGEWHRNPKELTSKEA